VKRRLLSHVLILLMALAADAVVAAESASHFFSLNTGDLKAELSDARSEGKRGLMLFFEQEGCPGCRHMKQNVFNRKDVQAYYLQHFASLALDIYGSVQIRDFGGREMPEKAFAQALKIRATPTFVFFDNAGKEIVRIVGPLETPEEFLLLGRFVATGEYKNRSFSQFKLQKGS
jgi:thioredoxin-related protein